MTLLLVVGMRRLAVLAQLSGAIVATGSVKVDRNLKAIQHRDGGIVSEIAVREGDFVRQDQVLLRLDDVQTRAEMSIIRSQIDELIGRRARLVAERDMLPEMRLPRWITKFLARGDRGGSERDEPVPGQPHQSRKPEGAA